MADSFINRYKSFCKCLAGLKEAKYRDSTDEFEKFRVKAEKFLAEIGEK